MRTPRGLSLIEALVATALMATIVVACLPLLRAAGDDLAAHRTTIDLFDLERFADALLANPGGFGLAAVPEGKAELTWPAWLVDELAGDPVATPVSASAKDAPIVSRPPVRVSVLRADDPTLTRAWLVLESGGQCVCRWIDVAGAAGTAGPGMGSDAAPAGTTAGTVGSGAETGPSVGGRAKNAKPASDPHAPNRTPRQRTPAPGPSGRSRQPRRRSKRVAAQREHAHVRHVRSRRHGLTLFEVLLSLVIVSLLLAAVAAWTGTAARAAFDTKRRVEAETPVEALFRLIADDLSVGDFAPPEEADGNEPGTGTPTPGAKAAPSGDTPPPSIPASAIGSAGAGSEDSKGKAPSTPADAPPSRATILDDRLRIETRRSVGQTAGPLTRDYRLDRGAGAIVQRDRLPSGAFVSRELLHGVDEWSCRIDDRLHALEIVVRVHGAEPIMRRFPLP
ncbi:MAG: prepilin-type N-terminal cleavage/methylation domain-containing protein [Phycisphaerales bacterium]|nr:prepilin-type N-terminal cleavage/methylation domain-containing protein [Phycisphaerales bacterium]